MSSTNLAGNARIRAEYLTIDEVAEYLKVTKFSVYKMTQRGATDPIPHVKIHGKLRFPLAWIDQWIEKKRIG